MHNVRPMLAALGAAAVLAGCRGGSSPSVSALPNVRLVQPLQAGHKVGLGAVLNTKDGGQVFGFDVDQNGNDGALASALTIKNNGATRVSVETFDQNSGAITSSFANETGTVNSYGFDGIFFGDVGLVTHYYVPKGQLFAQRFYEVMNPVTAQKFTGKWMPPIKDIDVLQAGVNQTTSESVLFAIELKNNDNPDLVVTNIAADTVSKTIHLDPNLFGGADGPQLAQYITANEAVIALSPDGGTVGGQAPLNVVVNLQTGKTTQFSGYNNGGFHAGFVNGAAVDPNTGVEVTTTELNSQVEFYDVKHARGITFVQLPCTNNTDQTTSGAGIVNDPIHKLFLVMEPQNACGPGGAVQVYDEAGHLVETITRFGLALSEPPAALNPSKRMGWAFGPQFNQLQQFFY